MVLILVVYNLMGRFDFGMYAAGVSACWHRMAAKSFNFYLPDSAAYGYS